MIQRIKALAETMKTFPSFDVQKRKVKENEVLREILQHEQSVIQLAKFDMDYSLYFIFILNSF